VTEDEEPHDGDGDSRQPEKKHIFLFFCMQSTDIHMWHFATMYAATTYAGLFSYILLPATCTNKLAEDHS
jgi:hypothetical protein